MKTIPSPYSTLATSLNLFPAMLKTVKRPTSSALEKVAFRSARDRQFACLVN